MNRSHYLGIATEFSMSEEARIYNEKDKKEWLESKKEINGEEKQNKDR